MSKNENLKSCSRISPQAEAEPTMTTIEITKRVQTVIQRAIEVKWDKFVAEGERIRHNERAYEQMCEGDCQGRTEPIYYEIITKGIRIIFEFDFSYYHADECHMDGMVEYDDECLCEKEVNYQVRLAQDKLRLYQGDFFKTKTKEEVMEYFSNMPATFTLCQCSRVATYKGWCDECFIKRQYHPEDEESPCAICHDYEGVWLKTDCKHYFHKSCFFKIESKTIDYVECYKCPLCRNMVSNFHTDI